MVRSQLDFMFGLLSDLDGYLKAGNLPHYFLPDCNLLVTVGPGELHTARNVITRIMSHPIRAILKCPTDVQDIYGGVRSDALVAAFQQVSSNPTCARSRSVLLQLLSQLDVKRRQRYQQQREEDDTVTHTHSKVSGRPELAGLVDMLKQIQKYRVWWTDTCTSIQDNQ